MILEKIEHDQTGKSGIEIEFIVSSENNYAIREKIDSLFIWNITEDASITVPSPRNKYFGIEISTKYPMDVQQLVIETKKVLTIIYEYDGFVNKSCGVHVHHSTKIIYDKNQEEYVPAISLLSMLQAIKNADEQKIYKVFPDRVRNQYSKSVNLGPSEENYIEQIIGLVIDYYTNEMYDHFYNKLINSNSGIKINGKSINDVSYEEMYNFIKNKINDKTLSILISQKIYRNIGRAYGINLAAIQKHGTIEFRYANTLNFAKIRWFIEYTFNLFEKSLKSNNEKFESDLCKIIIKNVSTKLLEMVATVKFKDQQIAEIEWQLIPNLINYIKNHNFIAFLNNIKLLDQYFETPYRFEERNKLQNIIDSDNVQDLFDKILLYPHLVKEIFLNYMNISKIIFNKNTDQVLKILNLSFILKNIYDNSIFVSKRELFTNLLKVYMLRTYNIRIEATSPELSILLLLTKFSYNKFCAIVTSLKLSVNILQLFNLGSILLGRTAFLEDILSYNPGKKIINTYGYDIFLKIVDNIVDDDPKLNKIKEFSLKYLDME